MKKLITVLVWIVFLSLLCFHKAYAETHEEKSTDLYKNQLEALQVFNSPQGTITFTDDDVYLMAQVVYAESRSEPYEGKVAVASVILNRLCHPEFPKTIRDVITQKAAFSCVQNGEISVIPDADSYSAVLDALKGVDPSEKAVFFYNPRIATSTWMKNIGKKNIKTIGNHVFFTAN